MKTFEILLLLYLAGIVIACCGQKSGTSCCGKGKCNIFCCNCDGGCKSYEECCRIECGIGCIKGGEMPLTCTSICRKRCKERTRELGEDNLFAAFDPVWLAMSDDQIFEVVRSDNKDHFTFEEFLKQRGWEDNSDAREFFDRFDRNKDGVISAEEMREPTEDDNENLVENVSPNPISTATMKNAERSEL